MPGFLRDGHKWVCTWAYFLYNLTKWYLNLYFTVCALTTTLHCYDWVIWYQLFNLAAILVFIVDRFHCMVCWARVGQIPLHYHYPLLSVWPCISQLHKPPNNTSVVSFMQTAFRSLLVSINAIQTPAWAIMIISSYHELFLENTIGTTWLFRCINLSQ